MIENPEVVSTEPQPTAVVRLTIPRDQIRDAMGPAFDDVFGAIEAQGIAPAGPTYSYHFRMDPDMFDFEVGVIVASPIAPSGRVYASETPTRGRVAKTVYVGDYEQLADGWGEFMAWIEAQGYATAEDLWEVYAVSPAATEDPAQWRTELYRPLA